MGVKMKHAKIAEQSKAKRTKCPSDIQTCQVSILRMSEKFVEPPKQCFKRNKENCVGLLGGLGACSPRKILKIMYPRLAEIAFHGISAVKIKCDLTIYLNYVSKVLRI